MVKAKKENKRREPKIRQWDKEGWKSLARTIGLILLACTLAVGLPLGGYFGYTYLVATGYFTPKNIQIKGNFRVSDAEILETSGITLDGVNLMELDASKICQQIESHDWIDTVDIQVKLPDNITIFVKEREPLGIVNDDKLYVVDKSGAPIKLWTKDDDVIPPLVSGNNILEKRPEIIRNAFHIAHLCENTQIGRIDEIHYEDATGFSLFHGKTEVRLGYDRFDERIERLAQVNDILTREHVAADYILIDSNTNIDHIVVRTHKIH